MLVGIRDGVRIERVELQHSEAVVREPLRILLRRRARHAGDTIAEDMRAPLDLLFDGGLDHLADEALVEEVGELGPNLADEIRKQRDVRQLVAADIGDDAAGREHLHLVHERIEECEAVVEVERLEEEVRDDRAEEVVIRRLVEEVLIDLSDVLVPAEEDLVVAPEIVDLVALLALDDRFEDRRVRLRVDRFLIRLDRHDELHLGRGDVVGEVGQVHRLDGIEEDEEGEDALVRVLFLGREVGDERPRVVLEPRDLLRHPEVPDHHLIERLRPRVLHGVQIEESGRVPPDDRARRERVVALRVENGICFHFVFHMCEKKNEE